MIEVNLNVWVFATDDKQADEVIQANDEQHVGRRRAARAAIMNVLDQIEERSR